MSRVELSQAPARAYLAAGDRDPSTIGALRRSARRDRRGQARDAVDAEPSGYALDFKA
jgi:hypothetical protein